MDILVVGAGYVGLVAAICWAEMGHHVVCLDINQSKVERLRQCELPIYEPGLAELLTRNVLAKRLAFTTDIRAAVKHGNISFLAVDTPMGGGGASDLSFVLRAAASIAEHMTDYKIVVNKSTVPVGTAARVRQTMSQVLVARGVEIPFDVASNPEFLKEGDAVNDFMKPDRIVLGVDSERVAATLRDVYAPFMLSHERLLIMDVASAEMAKYAANVALATRISLMNELAILCEETGADIDKVRRAVGADHRIGYQFLYAGVGFGGSCLPKDLASLRVQGAACGVATPLLDAVDAVNTAQKRRLWDKIAGYYGDLGGVAGRCFAILGLAFKPNTDDMREAPSLVLIQQLLQAGTRVRLYDPVAMEQAKRLLPDTPAITWCDSEVDAASGADAVVLVTEWKQFRLLDFEALKRTMHGHAFFDGRNQYLPAKMAEYGFDYISIGRQPVYAAAEILYPITESTPCQ